MPDWTASVFLIKDSQVMAKAATNKAVKPAKKAVRPGRRIAAEKPAKLVKAPVPAKRPTVAKTPVVSKDELRARLEKAQITIASLRTKGREAIREAKASAAQIAELEAKVAQLEKKLSAQEKPSRPTPTAEKPTKPRGRKAASRADADAPVESADPAPAEAET
jgi:hypothetical protein